MSSRNQKGSDDHSHTKSLFEYRNDIFSKSFFYSFAPVIVWFVYFILFILMFFWVDFQGIYRIYDLKYLGLLGFMLTFLCIYGRSTYPGNKSAYNVACALILILIVYRIVKGMFFEVIIKYNENNFNYHKWMITKDIM